MQQQQVGRIVQPPRLLNLLSSDSNELGHSGCRAGEDNQADKAMKGLGCSGVELRVCSMIGGRQDAMTPHPQGGVFMLLQRLFSQLSFSSVPCESGGQIHASCQNVAAIGRSLQRPFVATP